jgi:hypothetical protein
MQYRLKRAFGVAVVMALASPVAAMAQETFLRCSGMIISFNPTSQAIVQYDIDGNRLGSLCRLKDEQALGDRRSRVLHSFSDLQCEINDAEITVKYNWNRVDQRYDPIRGWETVSRFAPRFTTGLRIDRRSGNFMYDRPAEVSDRIFGTCEAIERPTPRPNRF